MATLEEQKKFLEEDLRDALRWLFVGAVAWHAPDKAERCPNQKALAMFTSLVQARALYDFFYNKKGQIDDALAFQFAPTWTEDGSKNPLYSKYMASRMPANKRVFHLVYDRSAHAGGTGDDGPDHLKNQVLKFAQDLRRLTEAFGNCVEPHFRDIIQSALRKALDQAECAANVYGIANPL
jgi:hypothetical protein